MWTANLCIGTNETIYQFDCELLNPLCVVFTVLCNCQYYARFELFFAKRYRMSQKSIAQMTQHEMTDIPREITDRNLFQQQRCHVFSVCLSRFDSVITWDWEYSAVSAPASATQDCSRKQSECHARLCGRRCVALSLDTSAYDKRQNCPEGILTQW